MNLQARITALRFGQIFRVNQVMFFPRLDVMPARRILVRLCVGDILIRLCAFVLPIFFNRLCSDSRRSGRDFLCRSDSFYRSVQNNGVSHQG